MSGPKSGQVVIKSQHGIQYLKICNLIHEEFSSKCECDNEKSYSGKKTKIKGLS